MSSFELSTYQKNILDNVNNSNTNLLVNAKAGSGKTSTLILIANNLIKQNKKCLFLAFNKSIVDELSTKIINENCQIKTIHALGLSFLRSYLYRKHNTNYELNIDDGKVRDITKKYFMDILYNDFMKVNKDIGLDEEMLKDLMNDVISELIKLSNFCRLYNINYHDELQVKFLMRQSCRELRNYDSYGLQRFPEVIETIIDKIKFDFEHPVINDDGKAYYNIDFLDMIYFPCYYNMFVPFSIKQYLDCILVDESQDLSILQQNFLRLLQTNDNRFIFVGDEKQAIYGFAGADTKSIENLKQNFILKELPLNICYRCPENVIKLSKSIVPSIEWNPKREDKGVVEFVDDIFKVDLQPNDMIIGRRNRDLIEIYKKFVIDKKVSVKFKNLKLVDSLVKEISQCIKDYIKLYVKNLNVDMKVYEYQKLNHMPLLDKDLSDSDKRELSKVRKEYIKQKSKESKKIMKSNYTLDYLKECMEEFREEGLYFIDKEALLSQYFDIIDSFIVEFMKDHSSILVKDLLDYIKSFLKGNLYEEAPVISTIHMMKGGEADTVYIYDYPKFPYKFKEQSEDEIQQEKNLLYVAITRAKKNLYLCLLKEDDEQSIEANLKARVNVKNLLKK